LALTGAKLQCITQALAYKALRAKKLRKLHPRSSTEKNVKRVQIAIEEAYGVQATSERIWKSIRDKAIMPECTNFMWTSMHEAYMIGDKWLEWYDGSKPEHEEKRARAICKKCGVTESMDHILFNCDAPGQESVWNLTKALWEETGREWRAPNFGTVMGAACAVFTSAGGARIKCLERLWAILISTSAYLIWKLRCERVIQNDGAEFSPQEVKNRWRLEVRGRLDLDRRMTHRKYEKKALPVGLVEATWRPVILGYESLPPGWVGNDGVLVGIKGG
ncbi:hypothetical protein EV121DRAFT_199747, partial [Schizophyllum commune]